MFWSNVANIVIRYRLFLLIFVGLVTIWMGYISRSVELSYDYLRILPADDDELAYFTDFKKTFGEDGNLVVVGSADKKIFELKYFNRYKSLIDSLQAIPGINEVISLPKLKTIKKNLVEKRFELVTIFNKPIESQSSLDTLLQYAKDQKMYDGQLLNEQTGALLMAVSINKNYINTSIRQVAVNRILKHCEQFSKETGIVLHYAGIPYIRSVMSEQVANELKIFLLLSFLISGVILFIFFRSWDAVVVPLALVVVVVIWVFGTLSLFNYKITILTGLIPSLIVITGIPNFIYLINKYHQEFIIHRNKLKAIAQIIKSIGVVTFMVNATTAVGFLVLCSSNVALLKEFGIIAGLNIMVAFVISIILIPAVLVYLPEPSDKQLKHLNSEALNKIINWSIDLTFNNKTAVYVVTGIIVLISIFGIFKIQTISFMVDDVPEKLTLKSDLRFFEKHFKGIMPLEFVIDTKKKGSLMNLKNLHKIEEFENWLKNLPEVSNPVSINTFLKGSAQAFYEGDPSFYELPTNNDKAAIYKYLKKQQGNQNLIRSFIDSTGQKIRISCKVADVGSIKLDSLVNYKIKPKAEEIFGKAKFDVKLTGTTLLFVRGNNMLINSLNSSIAQSILFNAILMAMLFASFRMIMITLIQNFIPLIITAAIMGYFGIPLKPSTSIIFSIVFGITVDNTIHFLAKYRYEIFNHKLSVRDALRVSIIDAGPSMIYTSIVLFFGFIIFAASNFGGTIALGILTSITLLTALATNFTILPALLLSFDRGRKEKDFTQLIEHFEGFYVEEDDEDIDISRLEIKKNDVDLD